MTITRKLLSIFSSKPKKTVTYDLNNPVIKNANILKNNAVNCRHCGSIAIPIEKKGKSYRCIQCDKQQTGISYNFGDRDVTHKSLNVAPKGAHQLIDITYYDDAVNFIKNGNKK